MPRRSPVWRRLLDHSSAALGLAVLSVLVLGAILAPVLARDTPEAQDLGQALLPPSREHPLGTDELGRDIYSRILYGARISLGFSGLTVLASAAVGATIGIVAGYYGGWLDEVIMRLIDILLAFPGILLAVTIVGVLGTGLGNVLLAIAIYITPGFARVGRGVALSVKQNEYIEAARSIGARNRAILLKHILPNCISPLLVQATLRVGTVILLTSGLSFLGLGPKPPTPEWGLMLSTADDYLRVAPHVSLVPGAFIMLAVLGVNLLGDALRDVLDPQQAT